MTSILGRFPASWRTDAVVLRGGGRDPRGNPLPVEEFAVTGLLAAPRATSEPVDRADLTTANGVVYHDGSFEFRSTDRIRFPSDSYLPGTWAVDGEPSRWPIGVEVPLRKDGA